MKKIISFCLYGTDYKYFMGAISNAELSPIVYPGWICRFYCSYSVPNDIIKKLKSYSHCEVIMMDDNVNYLKMFWRFLAIDDDDVEVMLSRDCDSRLCFREKVLVDIFMESDKLLHSIRDNPNHTDIMGGMWDIKKNDRIRIKDYENHWSNNKLDSYGSDQWFIRQEIVPKFSDSYMIHCSVYHKNFPFNEDEILSNLIENPKNNHFIGEVYPQDNYGRPLNYIFC